MSKSYNPNQSSRLFKNPALEALTHVHPSVPFIVWIPIVLYFLYQTLVATELGVGLLAVYFGLGLFFGASPNTECIAMSFIFRQKRAWENISFFYFMAFIMMNPMMRLAW